MATQLTRVKSSAITANTLLNSIVVGNGLAITANNASTILITINHPHPFLTMGV
jgi:hypothetical protein